MTTDLSPAAQRGAAAREVELKLHIDPRDLPRVAVLPVLRDIADGLPVTRRLHTVYYDTPDLRLAAAGVALRVRRQGNGHVQAVKTMAGVNPGDSAGVAVRREWEWPLPGDQPDLSLLEAEGAGGLIPDDLRAALVPVFASDFERTVLNLKPDAATAVELAVDDGHILAGPATERISEIELELKSGRMGRLFDLALAIQRFIPVRMGTDNKAEIGYRLVTGRSPAPAAAEPLGLAPMTTVAEAFRHIVRHGIRQVLANEPCALAGADAEGLHRIRIALRRTRFALRLFRGAVESPETKALRKDIRWLDDRLRPARDWDVVAAAVLPAFARAKGTTEPPKALVTTVNEVRRDPAAAAFEALSGPRASRLLLTLGAWIEEGAWHARADEERRALLDRAMAEVSGPWLDRLHARARKAGRVIDAGDAEGIEVLRRRLRKLRYAVDFVRGLHPPSPTRAYAAALEPLLAGLDELHDLSVAATLLETLRDRQPDVRDAVEAVQRWTAKQTERRHKALPELWRGFRDAAVFWG